MSHNPLVLDKTRTDVIRRLGDNSGVAYIQDGIRFAADGKLLDKPEEAMATYRKKFIEVQEKELAEKREALAKLEAELQASAAKLDEQVTSPVDMVVPKAPKVSGSKPSDKAS